jgi:hypothetical protein
MAENLADLLGRIRQYYYHRRLTIRGQSVRFVRQHLRGGVDHTLSWHDGAQRRNDFRAASENGLVR